MGKGPGDPPQDVRVHDAGLVRRGEAGRAAAIYYSLVERCKVNQVNPLTCLTYVLSHVRDPRVVLLTPNEYAEQHARDVTRIG